MAREARRRNSSLCLCGELSFFPPPRLLVICPPSARVNKPLIVRNPGILGGRPVFAGTRVPVSFLFEYLEAGDSLDEFLDGFPTVRRAQAVAVLEVARKGLLARAA
jgi:uncharacterized protein (DUF433 family)